MVYTEGKGDGQFQGASGGAVDPGGNAYVVDFWNDRVQKFAVPATFSYDEQANKAILNTKEQLEAGVSHKVIVGTPKSKELRPRG